jgi:hypothetical protein
MASLPSVPAGRAPPGVRTGGTPHHRAALPLTSSASAKHYACAAQAVVSAALQDQLLRNLGLAAPRQPPVVAANARTHHRLSSPSAGSQPPRPAAGLAATMSHGVQPLPVATTQTSAGSGRPAAGLLRELLVVNERVLDSTPRPATLAERLGIVPAPEQALSASEWQVVRSRAVAQNRAVEPCAICLEPFRLEDQVRE